jgi:colicin import membrane protein
LQRGDGKEAMKSMAGRSRLFDFARFARARSNGRALFYAALVHLILLIALLYGMHWKNRPSAGAQVELWSAAELTPAPPEQHTVPVPVPFPSEQSRTLPAPAPAQSAPSRPEPAEIALERARQRQKQEALRRAQQQERENQRLRPQPLAEQEEKAAQEKKRRVQSRQQPAQQQRPQPLSEQQRQEQKKADPRKALQAQQQAAQQAREKAQIEQQRRARLEALAQAAGANAGGAGAVGQGGGISGSPGYADKVQRRVKPNIMFDTQTLSGNPHTIVSIQCAPDGAVLNARIVRSSGFPAWDEAVLRAVQKSDPMPLDADGRAPSRFTITFRPKD